MRDRQLSFRIEGPQVKDGNIAFKHLAGILTGVQQTFYYIALSDVRKETRHRVRVPADIQQACELYRVSEEKGSYQLVACVAEPAQGQVFPDLGKVCLEKYLQLVNGLSDPDGVEGLIDVFPDSIHRRRILRSVEAYCPKEGDEWNIEVASPIDVNIGGVLTKEVRRRISQALTEQEVELRTITGELVRLHLDEHKLGIIYYPTGRVLDCYYNQEIEDFVIQNLKGYVQVTGRVQLDSNGHPDKIIDVSEIQELDLSTIKLSVISSSDTKIELNEPIRLVPKLEGQEITLELPQLNIIAEGSTRDYVIRNFEDDFVWVWKEYGLAQDESLSNDGLQLKKFLCGLVKEV